MITVLLISAFLSVEQPAPKVPVFVKSAATASGFSDPSKARQDSVEDLAKRVKDSKVLALVPEPEALVILEVIGRDTRRDVNMFGAQNKSYLTVRLTAGEYSTELSGESGSKGVMSGYGDAAKRVVQQLESWVKANREKLSELAKR
jgi:hypothetical protein